MAGLDSGASFRLFSSKTFEDEMKRVMALLEVPKLLKDLLSALEKTISPQEREAAI